jgi:hypothetical protein
MSSLREGARRPRRLDTFELMRRASRACGTSTGLIRELLGHPWERTLGPIAALALDFGAGDRGRTGDVQLGKTTFFALCFRGALNGAQTKHTKP